MTQREKDLYKTRRRLQDHDWNVHKGDSIGFNAGSETLKHLYAKAVVGWYLKQHGYRIDSEVTMPDGEVDILAYRGDDILVVECETSPLEDVIKDKLDRYVYGQPPRDLFVINVNELPTDVLDAQGYVKDVIGL
jgi:hypothetical protein